MKPERCILLSAEGHGRALIRLHEGERLDIELTLYRQIEKYVDSPKASAAAPSLKKILLERKDENRERRQRLVHQISELIVNGDCFAKGQRVSAKGATAPTVLDELLNYLITNTYNKLPYLKVRQSDPIAEIKALLNADDLAQRSLALGGEEGNPQALDEVRQYLLLAATQNRVLLSDVVARFTDIPFGWKPDWEVVLLVTRLFMAGEIKLTMAGSDLDPRSAFEPLTKSVQHKQVSILKRKTADATSIGRVADLYKELFAALPRKDEDGVVADFRSKLQAWEGDLKTAHRVASLPHHPGTQLIEDLLARCARQLAIRDSFEFIDALNKGKNDWLDAGEDYATISGFYQTQLPTWQRLLAALVRLHPNREALSADAKASAALRDLEQIRDLPAPYGQINKIDGLIAVVDAGNADLLQRAREASLLAVERLIGEVQSELSKVSASAELSNAALYPLQQTKLKIAGSTSIPEIAYLQTTQAGQRLDEAMDCIVEAAAKARASAAKSADPSGTTPTPAPKPEVALKTSQTIRPAKISNKTYLDNESEVNQYLAALKSELLAVLQAGKRIRIE